MVLLSGLQSQSLIKIESQKKISSVVDKLTGFLKESSLEFSDDDLDSVRSLLQVRNLIWLLDISRH